MSMSSVCLCMWCAELTGFNGGCDPFCMLMRKRTCPSWRDNQILFYFILFSSSLKSLHHLQFDPNPHPLTNGIYYCTTTVPLIPTPQHHVRKQYICLGVLGHLVLQSCERGYIKGILSQYTPVHLETLEVELSHLILN